MKYRDIREIKVIGETVKVFERDNWGARTVVFYTFVPRPEEASATLLAAFTRYKASYPDEITITAPSTFSLEKKGAKQGITDTAITLTRLWLSEDSTALSIYALCRDFQYSQPDRDLCHVIAPNPYQARKEAFSILIRIETSATHRNFLFPRLSSNFQYSQPDRDLCYE